MKSTALVSLFLVLATCCVAGDTVAQAAAQPQTQAPVGTGAPEWIPVAAAEWPSLAGSLIGKSVELSGDLETMILVDPESSLGNVGKMRDAQRVELARILFDAIGREEIDWMAKNRCHEGCQGVFVRGTVVTIPYAPAPVLRMKEVSFESRAGVAPAAMVSIAGGDGATAPGNEKTLLPSGGVPATGCEAPAALEIPTPAAVDNPDKSTWGQLTARGDEMRQRDYNMDRGIIPGPERPADFETCYRSIRDTRLSNVFRAPLPAGRARWQM